MKDLRNNNTYSENEIIEMGLEANNSKYLDIEVYKKDNQVYFFEKTDNNLLRLFTTINERSYFLK